MNEVIERKSRDGVYVDITPLGLSGTGYRFTQKSQISILWVGQSY
jgi:hypothetical protein